MEPEKKIARLAIGVEGGFNPDANKKRYEYEEHNSVVVLPSFSMISLPNPELPEIVSALSPGLASKHSPKKIKLPKKSSLSDCF